jgi:uncharacterized protein YycO
MLNKRIMKNTIIFTAILICTSQFISAQEIKDEKQLTEIVSNLKQKILLSNDQEANVLNILTELKNNISTKPDNKDLLVKAAQTKVESLLDEKQKMKYDILKNNLWKQITE